MGQSPVALVRHVLRVKLFDAAQKSTEIASIALRSAAPSPALLDSLTTVPLPNKCNTIPTGE
jgi:hypothetical protein